MNRAAILYAETSFPGHRIHPVRTVESRHIGGRTVMASYRSLREAADAAAHLPTRAEWDEIEVLELVGPEPSLISAVDPQGPAGLTPQRVGAGAVVGAVLGGAIALVACLVTGATVVLTVGSVLIAAVLAGIVGFAASGVHRFGGDHAEQQAPAPTLATSVAVLTVWTPDERVANVVAHALGRRDTIEVRIFDDEGHWHLPAAD